MMAAGTTLYRPFQSNIPSAIDALVAVLAAKFAGVEPPVMVKDGPFTSEESANQLITIGWSGFARGYEYPSRSMSEELGEPDASSTQEIAGMGGGQLEHYIIGCAAISRNDTEATNKNTSANRATAFGLVTTVGSFLQPPGPYLNGNTMRVIVGQDTKLYQVVDSRGQIAVVTFQLHCDAFSAQ